VGAGALGGMLAALPAPRRDDVVLGAGDDAGAVRIGGQVQVLSTDHLRAFTLDPWLLARVAAIHALGDVWAMGAAPQVALSSLTLPQMSDRLHRRTLAEMMQAAGAVMAAAGAEIIGGHTTQGAELTAGFTVTGLAAGDPIGLAGARPGDALILTKPIGTGVILAAEMACKADGRDVIAAYGSMTRMPIPDAARLRGAHAMTDVTGFGLAGHLLAICDASGCGAALTLADIPVLPGAEALAARGLRSSLFASNHADAGPRVSGGTGPRADLLFDPQTAGGLLAAVEAAEAEALCAGLRADGAAAAIIGHCTDGAPMITLR
jgi:selenide,water dikinase